ncbi:MAG: methyltransferase domain-containing protein [Ruminococcaceae bacterium]|nr:methyltransferase domain-containing protein [Oscillospiraceae bacterium]
MWSCPICSMPLRQTEGVFRCPANHCFDVSKHGYVHLLPSNRMHGKMPGDNKLMVQARRRFLQEGYYTPLADAVAACAVQYVREGDLLDIGCGEGYYTHHIEQALQSHETEVSCYGLDISKYAIEKAARSYPAIRFAVASAFRIPMASESCAGAINLFAPFCGEEIIRILKHGGYLIMAVPGTDHLWELKNALYDRPYRNEVKPFELKGLDLIHEQHMQYRMQLPQQQTIQDLFMMTPYYYKTGQEDQQKLLGYDTLDVTAEFHLLVYKRP